MKELEPAADHRAHLPAVEPERQVTDWGRSERRFTAGGRSVSGGTAGTSTAETGGVETGSARPLSQPANAGAASAMSGTTRSGLPNMRKL